MRIFYAGTNDPTSTCFHRRLALEQLGNQVIPFDIFFRPSVGRLMAKAQYCLQYGPEVSFINQQFSKAVSDVKPDIIWVDKGIYLFPSTLAHAAQHTGATVHYNPDDPFGLVRRGWRHFRRAIPLYDLHLVPRAPNLAEYREAGAKRVLRFNWAFDPETHKPHVVSAAERKRIGGSVGFVGSYEIDRARTLYAIAQAGISVRIWGGGWHRCPFRHSNLRIECQTMTGDDYSMVLSAFDINLGFLRKMNRDLSTTRSVEIPGCGAFMLAERTTEHQSLFEEGKEADFFSSDAECIQKIKYYLTNPEIRRQIAKAGRQRCFSSGYDNLSRMRDILGQVQSILRL